MPQLERNEFQDFIAQSTGRVLPRYGFNLFSGAPSTFAPVDNIPVMPDYVIGPGDELLIRVWGQIDGEYRLAVDRDGTINIPKVGTISVSGIKMQDLQGYVRNAIARNFRNFELSVSLGQLRSIQIFVVGQARQPDSRITLPPSLPLPACGGRLAGNDEQRTATMFTCNRLLAGA